MKVKDFDELEAENKKLGETVKELKKVNEMLESDLETVNKLFNEQEALTNSYKAVLLDLLKETYETEKDHA